jgi:hypothetical protein
MNNKVTERLAEEYCEIHKGYYIHPYSVVGLTLY